jgi:hypothetical protein
MEASKPVAVGYTQGQRKAIRSTEEEATLVLVDDAIQRLNKVGDRLEAFLRNTAPPREE